MPDIRRDPCYLGGTLNDMAIINYNGTAQLCFDGDGYIGVAIYDVDAVYSYSVVNIWIRYYNPSGHYCTLPYNPLPLEYSDVVFGYPSSVKLTQIDIDASNGPHC